MGSLSNEDGDGDANENGEKTVGIDWQINNSARASRFFVHFYAVGARLQLETFRRFAFYGEREHKAAIFFFFSEILYSLLEFNFKKICQRLTKGEGLSST